MFIDVSVILKISFYYFRQFIPDKKDNDSMYYLKGKIGILSLNKLRLIKVGSVLMS